MEKRNTRIEAGEMKGAELMVPGDRCEYVVVNRKGKKKVSECAEDPEWVRQSKEKVNRLYYLQEMERCFKRFLQFHMNINPLFEDASWRNQTANDGGQGHFVFFQMSHNEACKTYETKSNAYQGDSSKKNRRYFEIFLGSFFSDLK